MDCPDVGWVERSEAHRRVRNEDPVSAPFGGLRSAQPTLRVLSRSERRHSPVADAAVGVEHALRHFLLEGMFSDLVLVHDDAEPRTRVRSNGAARFLENEPFLDDI